jgi:hypothetical protein
MAFPAVDGSGSGEAASGDLTVTLPGTLATNDLVIIVLQASAATDTWAQQTGTTGWNELSDASGQAYYYKVISSSEADPVFTGSTVRSAYCVWKITQGTYEDTPELSTGASGNSNSADPDSLDPTGTGAEDFLWIACAGGTDGRRSISTYPTDFDTNQHAVATGGGAANGCFVGGGVDPDTNAETRDPSAFGLSGVSGWRAHTLAVHPAAAGDFEVDVTEAPTGADSTTSATGDFEVDVADCPKPIDRLK